MTSQTARRLLRLNRDFYREFAGEFSATRARLAPGTLRALRLCGNAASLLDVGCGDGRVGRALRDALVPNSILCYRGVDFSPRLLRMADLRARDFASVTADLSGPGWKRHPALEGMRFDCAVCFAVLFHIPGARRRARLLREIRELLAPGGRAVISVWQFLHLPRLRKRVIPWEAVGLSQNDVEAGDLLVDWRRGGRGLRYVHHFSEEELLALCRGAGFSVDQTYRSDGESGDLSLFAVLSDPPRPTPR